MKRGDEVYFTHPKTKARSLTRIESVYDDVEACRISLFGGMVVRQSECEPIGLVDMREAQAKYADIIKAWTDGARTLQDIAKALSRPVAGLWPRVDAAKRKGLIRE